MPWTLEPDQPTAPQSTTGKWTLEDQPTAQAAAPASQYSRSAQEGLGVAKGASDPFVGGSQLVMQGLNKIGVVSDDALNTHMDYYKNLEDKYQQATPEGSGIGRVAGNVLATLPLAFTPGGAAGTLAKISAGIKTGAVSGALQPVNDGDHFAADKAKQIGLGAFTGGLVPGVGAATSRVINPRTAEALQAIKSGSPITPQLEAKLGNSLNVAKMINEDVRVTPGQILGGAAKRAEEAATSIPIVGDIIKSAIGRSTEDFNRSAVNRALAPIGQKVSKDEQVGYKLIDKAHDLVSQNYDELLPKLNPLQVDKQLDTQMSNVIQMAKNMHPDYAQQFDSLMQNEVFRKFTPAGTMSSESMKEVESQLGKYSRQFGRSQDGNQQQLADALKEAQSVIRQAVERQNPAHAGELKKANLAFAELLRVENAAGLKGAKEGIFSPTQYEGAVRALDPSLRKSQFARGKALGQDFATAADATLSNKVPDSGTPFRSMLALGAAGGGAMINPAIPVGLAAGAALYTQPAQKMLQFLMTKRPDLAPEIARHLELAAGKGALIGPAMYGSPKH